MSKLVWDEVGNRFYETGVNQAVLYPQGVNGKYPKGVVWNGITGITESPSGAEASDLYADNIKYATLRSAETLGGTIEAYTYPDEWGACDGSAEPVKGLKIGQQSRATFGLSYKTLIGNDTASSDDDGYNLHLVYGATASPSERAYATVNDSPEAITFSWEFQTTPINVEGYKPTSSLTLNSLALGLDVMKAVEDILYGSDDKEARLPLPDEIIEIIKQSTLTEPDTVEDTEISG